MEYKENNIQDARTVFFLIILLIDFILASNSFKYVGYENIQIGLMKIKNRERLNVNMTKITVKSSVVAHYTDYKLKYIVLHISFLFVMCRYACDD